MLRPPKNPEFFEHSPEERVRFFKMIIYAEIIGTLLIIVGFAVFVLHLIGII